MGHKIMANVRKITLTEEYQEVTQSDSREFFRLLQIVNNTGGDITYALNPSNDPPTEAEEVILQDGDVFSLSSDDVGNLRADVVLMKGDGDIVVEMDFYQPA